MTGPGGLSGETLFRGRRLCVVGNINRDLRTAPIRGGAHLVRDGETSTDFVRETLGGGAANSAVFASKLGAVVRLVGKVGDDALGAALRLKLRLQGVRPHLAVDPAHATGTSINLVYDKAERAGRLHAIVHDGEWFHVGTPDGLAATRARLASHRTER